tara:strand:+ start:1626 stop:1784 length:159 start_codon:yes stop_codon:yes gene_type:complete
MEKGDIVIMLGISGFHHVEYKIMDFCKDGYMIVENQSTIRRVKRSEIIKIKI